MEDDAVNSQQSQANRRLGLILGTVAVAFFLGFLARVFVLSGQLA
jgi:hypothetical protein